MIEKAALVRAVAVTIGLALGSLASLEAHSASASSTVPSGGSPAQQPAAVSPEEVERLRALGYAGFDRTPGQEHPDGVGIHDPARSAPGYNLYTNPRLCSAVLMDGRGEVVNRWSADPCGKWFHATLLDSGELLVPGTDSKAGDGQEDDLEQRYLLALSWTGKTLWKRRLPIHHDIEPAGSNGLVGLLASNRREPGVDPATPLRDNPIARFTREGVVEEQRSLLDLLRAAAPAAGPIAPIAKRRGGAVDLLHANAVQWLDRAPDLGVGPRDAREPHVLVTIRHQDLVVLVKWSDGRIVWSWGRGELSGPHDGTVLPSGNVLVFDNGLGRGWSRVVEIDPRTRSIVWQYRTDPPESFYTVSRGSSQRLPNGNTLIAESDRGHAFEVTPAGEVVWDFWNPIRNARGERSTIVRMRRIEPRLVDAILRRESSSQPAPQPPT